MTVFHYLTGTPGPITVICGTYGDDEWIDTALTHAKPSVDNAHFILCHDTTLASARNRAAEHAVTPWLCFMDADDQLGRGFTKVMERSLSKPGIYRPSTIGVYEDGSVDPEPILIPRCDLSERNYIVIAAVIPREDFLAVGGFGEYPMYEDWALWRTLVDRRCLEVYDVPEAVYRIYVRNESRNNNDDLELQHQTYHQIKREFGDQNADRSTR